LVDDIAYFVFKEGKRVVMRRYSLLLRRAQAELNKIKEVPGNSVIADQLRKAIEAYKSVLAAVNNIRVQDFLCEVQQGKPLFDITQFIGTEIKTKSKEAQVPKKQEKQEKQKEEIVLDPDMPLEEIHKKIKKPGFCRQCQKCGKLVTYYYYQKHLKSKCTKHIYGTRKFKNTQKEGDK
jgi:hypothetical protein